MVLRLLLREGVEPPARADAAEKAERVRRIHVVRLPADADERDRPRRVIAADGIELGPDLGDRRVPVDLLERAVGGAPHRVRHPVAVLDVVLDAERLVAHVAVADRRRLVATHLDDAPVLHVDADAAVVAAENAHGRTIGPVRADAVRMEMVAHARSFTGRRGAARRDVAKNRFAGRAVMSRAVTMSPQWSHVSRS